VNELIVCDIASEAVHGIGNDLDERHCWCAVRVHSPLSRGMTELIPTVKMERGHSVQGSFGR